MMGPEAEPPEDAAARIREVPKSIRMEKLWINSDCGLLERPRWIGVAKLRALVPGTRHVRHESGSA